MHIAAVRRPDLCAGLLITNGIGYDSWPIPSVKAMQTTAPVLSRLPAAALKPALGLLIARGHDDAARAKESSTDQVEDALDRGEENLEEVVYQLPRSAAGFVQRIDDLLTEVDTYCRSGGHLLTLAPPPDVAAYRRWSTEEVLRQSAGAAPRPWPAYAATQGVR